MRSAMRNRLASMRTVLRTPRVTSDEEVLELAHVLWSQLDTPLSLGLSLLARNGQLVDVLSASISADRYLDTDVTGFALDAQAIAFLRKMPLEIAGIDREEAAWVKFLESEELCRQTNRRLVRLREGGLVPPAVHAVLHIAQSKISRWLGSLDAQSWARRCRFGPGADNLTKGSRVSSYHKLSQLSSTEDFAEGAAALVYSHPPWVRHLNGLEPDDHGPLPGFLDVDVVLGNKLTFVPKSALIDRSIAIEPRLNIFAQLGLGALLRQRLKKNADLDLDQQEPSQVLAYLGSRNGSVATIDLSSASDTIAKELVRELLPEPWFNAMDWCRSKNGLYQKDDEKILIQYEKFSSMGNGFTFELESMIFYALTLACVAYCRDDSTLVRCFGDDIACPSGSVELLGEVLRFCGFTVNNTKSFSSGVFRESCGADFFNGVNVRPYFQKEPLLHVESLFRLANGLRRAAYRRNRGFGCDSKFKHVWDHCVRRIPPALRGLKGPWRSLHLSRDAWIDIECDDSYLAVNLDEAMSSPFVRRNPDGWCGWQFAGAVPTGRYESTAGGAFRAVYAHALYAGRDGASVVDSPHDHLGNRKIPLRGGGPRRVVPGLFTPGFFNIGGWS